MPPLTSLLDYLERISGLKLWLIFFGVTLLAIVLVQTVFLPYLFPAWHAGDGLLIGGDWIAFHNTAVDMADRIETEGWSHWQLWPRGWLPAGIAGTIYAFLGLRTPLALAPLNAAVHAFTALLVIAVLSFFVRERLFTLAASLPFVFFPSAMLWYTQIHRDGYNILGMLLFLTGMLLLIGFKEYRRAPAGDERHGLLAALGGVVLIWLARPHTLAVFFYVTLFFLLGAAAFYIFLAAGKKLGWKRVGLKLGLIVVVAVVMFFFSRTSGADKYYQDPGMIMADSHGEHGEEGTGDDCDTLLWASMQGPSGAVCGPGGAEDSVEFQPEAGPGEGNAAGAGLVQGGSVKETGTGRSVNEMLEDYRWERLPWLPAAVDNQFYSIAVLRSVHYKVAYGETRSGIDTDVSFHSAGDFVYYLPRALQIAFLAPFPADWFLEGSYASTTFFRRISAFEMIFVYLSFVPLLYGLWRWRKRIELYVLLLFCSVMMLPIVYSVPNVGTIYRYRYGYLMLLVCLGVAALAKFLQERRVARAETGRAGGVEETGMPAGSGEQDGAL